VYATETLRLKGNGGILQNSIGFGLVTGGGRRKLRPASSMEW